LPGSIAPRPVKKPSRNCFPLPFNEEYQERRYGMSESIYPTELVCSRGITFTIEDGILKNVRFHSGCHGSLQGISQLVEGMKVEDVVRRLKGIDCKGKGTSCPDQLVKALEQEMEKQKAE
jgi:uncharacterized protein (TIGR03905 family)